MRGRGRWGGAAGRVAVAVAMLAGAGACGANDARSAEPQVEAAVAADAAPAVDVTTVSEAAPTARLASVGAPAGAASREGGGAAASARMIVRSASLSLQVRDVAGAVSAVSDAVSAAEGFLGTSRRWRDGEHDRASMTVRVPAARLDATLQQLRTLAVRVDDESTSGEDVTRQAVDLQAQLVNLRATEVELRALLVTVRQKTQRAADVLEVHTELSRVRGEIEQRTAELQTLSQLVALSTITIELRPDVVAAPIASAGWQPRGVLRDATRALVQTARAGATVLIWGLVYGGPLALLAGGLVFVVRRLRLRQATLRTD